MRVLVACEFSGIVREAFARQGHEAVSCDLLPTEQPGQHRQGDMMEWFFNGEKWDLMIAFPPCTHLAVSGARWFKEKQEEQRQALKFVATLVSNPNVARYAIENPIGILSSRWRKPDQIIQPWQFGHPEFKATCIWLKGIKKLELTNVLTPPVRGTAEYKAWSKVHYAPPGPDRWKIRSRTYPGIADAMTQWGAS